MHELLHDLITATFILKTLASYHMLIFRIDTVSWLIQLILNLFLSFDFIIDHAVSAALSDARKHDFGHALSHVQSHLELSELDMRAHRQADVTDHQLHNQVYCGRYNINKRTMANKKWNDYC